MMYITEFWLGFAVGNAFAICWMVIGMALLYKKTKK